MSNWIANKDGCLKPAEEGKVIVTTETSFCQRDVTEAWYDDGMWFEGGHDISWCVIAWMPMPDPHDGDGYAESDT